MSTESPRRLFFPAAQQVGIESFEPPAVAEGEVRVRTEYSLMSTGTENIVFNRLFDQGTHWDGWVKYPFYPGYCVVGTVEESAAASSLQATVLPCAPATSPTRSFPPRSAPAFRTAWISRMLCGSPLRRSPSMARWWPITISATQFS